MFGDVIDILDTCSINLFPILVDRKLYCSINPEG